MKYIGENAIKKLISLIKGDLATKQPTITASGLLKGDGAGTVTAADTQEAILVDVPNGLLKGDGTTISAAVAGTDYVNSSQAIRYDAAQSLTDAQKTQARTNIAAAPDGFGLGGAIVYAPKNSDGVSDTNLINATGFYLAFANAVNSGWNYVFHMQYPSDAALQFSSYVNDTTYSIRKKIFGVWQPWEWINPPMLLGVEHRTTERYLGKPVYVKAINFGALPNATTKSVSHSASNVDVCIRATGSITSGDKRSIPFADINGRVDIFGDSGQVTIKTDYNYSSLSAHATIWYTKSTD